MSNSTRAKLRRSKRSRLSKHERGLMESQHFGDKHAHDFRLLKGRD